MGGAEGDRTPDLLIANQALSQLSYDPYHLGGKCTFCHCEAFGPKQSPFKIKWIASEHSLLAMTIGVSHHSPY